MEECRVCRGWSDTELEREAVRAGHKAIMGTLLVGIAP